MASIILSVEKLKAFTVRSRATQRCPLPPVLFNTVLEVLATTIRDEKEMNRILMRKGKMKFSLFAYYLTQYIEYPKDGIRKLLELVSEYGKDAGYSISTQKSLAFLYTNNEKSEREI